MAGSGSQPASDNALAASRAATSAALAPAQWETAFEPGSDKPDAVDTSSTAPGAPASSAAANTTDEAAESNGPQSRWQRWLSRTRDMLWSRSTPGFLVSLILHTLLLLVLAIITIAGPGRGGFATGILEVISSEQPEGVVEMVDPMMASGAVSDDATDSAEAEAYLAATGSQTINGGALGDGIKNLARHADIGSGEVAQTAQSAAGTLNEALSSSMNASLAHVGVDGRKAESRRRLALQRGGSAESEAAVELALEWLAAHQKPGGNWSLVHTTKDCGPYCTHTGSPERYEPAATGLALLAFLGAGHTHREGKYREVVNRGIYYLLTIMEETERGGSFMFSSPQGMYNQGIATFALCEAYQMTQDESLKLPAQRAVNFIVYAQNDLGGWGYLPKRPGDLTLTGWQTMALKSADSAGLYIPAQSVVRIDKFLDSQCDKAKIFYGYQVPTPKNETCTAIGLILRMFRGWQHSDPRVLDGAVYLERQGISTHDIYRNYYLTLLLYHVGGRTFDEWNPRMRDSLINSQEKSGHAKGSWYFDDKWCEVGGRHYTTAMAAMTLEVYYRFSPIYLNTDKPFEY